MDLTPDQEAEAQRIYQALKRTADQDLLALARLLASKPDAALLGRTEFEVRDRAHAIGARAIEEALAGRKKRATSAPAPTARPATARRGSSATGPARS
jgi:predicted GNAT family N-acyltransferase